jgi:hypothetical protein
MKTDPLREQLLSLPDLPPPDTLWPKLRRLQRQRVVRRRFLAGSGLAALGLSVGLLLSGNLPPHPVDRGASQAQATRRPDPDGRLQAVDRALQAAYARDASDAELAPLWDIRHRLAATSNTNPTQRELL